MPIEIKGMYLGLGGIKKHHQFTLVVTRFDEATKKIYGHTLKKSGKINFEGKYTLSNNEIKVEAKEIFSDRVKKLKTRIHFRIQKDGGISGTWFDIPERKTKWSFTLKRFEFVYDENLMLSEDAIKVWVGAIKRRLNINASTTKITSKETSQMSGQIEILTKYTIYARHGDSCLYDSLMRKFFLENVPWYRPTTHFLDLESKLSDLEKENIEFLDQVIPPRPTR